MEELLACYQCALLSLGVIADTEAQEAGHARETRAEGTTAADREDSSAPAVAAA